MTTFWQQLDERLAPYDLLQHPFYQAWTAGELTRDDLATYSAEYFHHVSAFPTYLSALHAQLPDSELRREVLRNLADEEGIDAANARPHSALWMDFATGMGNTREQVMAHELQPEMKTLVATFRGLMLEPPAAALAALYAYESRVPAISATKAHGLEKHYAADAATTKYFTLHRTADVHHAQVWRDLIDSELAASPESAPVALAAAETAAKALWEALSGVDRLRMN